MKKLVCVSLFVLMALTLSLAIGCKHDSDPEPVEEGSRTPFVGTWVDESGDITCTINADGTFVTQADKKYEGKYHVSPDGKTVTATTTVEGKEETFTLTLKSEDTLELTLPASFGGATVTLTKKVKDDSDPEQKPASSNFVGKWKSTDGSTTVTVTSATFTTEVTEMPEPFSGTYTVSPDGKTLTTSEITLEGMGGTKVAFSMKLKDSETDVMDLLLSEIGMEDNLVLVKVSTDKPDLTGTWTGKVVSAGNADATIGFTADNKATLNLAGQTVDSTDVTQDGNFFTVTWAADNALKIGKSTGLVSASGKAWLDDGSVFTKN